MKLQPGKIKSDYEKLIQLSQSSLDRGDSKLTCTYLKLLTRVMYLYNLQLSDKRADNIVKILAKGIISKQYKVGHKTIMFYDYYALERRGLAYIYVKALIKSNYKIVYVTLKKNQSHFEKTQLYSEMVEKGVDIEYIENNNDINQAKNIISIAEKFNAESVLAHTVPWDLAILMACFSLGDQIKKYLINITDHAFWIGESAFDYIVEFRSYGGSVSVKQRNINVEKIRLLPFYPIQIDEKFQGLPFELEHKKLILSGGGLYKISGSDKFYKVIKYILDTYSDTIFLYIGNGDSSELQAFVKDNQYEGRVFHTQERKDFQEIIKKCYIYISTYPLIGGLMTQYAAINKKYPITLRDESDYCNDVRGLLINPHETIRSFTANEEVYDEIDRVMNDEEYLKQQEQHWCNAVPNEEDFNKELKNLLEDYYTKYEIEDIEIDKDEFSKKYLESFNNNIYTYGKEYLKMCSLSIAFKFPMETIAGIIYAIKKIYMRIFTFS